MASNEVFPAQFITPEQGGYQSLPSSPNQPSNRNLLSELNENLDMLVKATLAEKIAEITAEQLPSPHDYFAVRLDQLLESSIKTNGYDSSLVTIAQPTKKNESTKGVDIAFNVAALAKAADENPIEVAEKLATQIASHAVIKESIYVGPFVNVSIDYAVVAPQILSEVTEMGEHYGHYREGEPKLVIVDYSSPNVAKNMTLAHLRSTIIGHTLTKIQKATGNIPFGVNHIGDWGTQFGSIIYQYNKELAERGDAFQAEIDRDPTATLMRIYRDFNEQKNSNPESVETAREIFLDLEKGDPELVDLWHQFRGWSLRDFGPSYDRLRITFDAIQGESFYEDRMTTAVAEGLDKGVLKVKDDKSVIFPAQPLTNPSSGTVNEKVMLDQDGQPRDEIIVKPSGGTMYLTRDLAAIYYRAIELGADKILYVIGKEQQTHCLELFAMAHQLGYMALGGAEHVSFGHLNVDGRKMKSREGKVVLLNEIVDESFAVAAHMISERKRERGASSELDDDELEVARKVGTSSLVFNDLRQDRQKDIEFNPDMAKSLETGGASYIQYTNSRLNSILEKVGEPDELREIPELSDEEETILREIAQLPLVVKDAAELNAPHKIATYLTAFCRNINAFYRERPVGRAGTEQERTFRLHLVKAAKQVLENASDLLHLELPVKM